VIEACNRFCELYHDWARTQDCPPEWITERIVSGQAREDTGFGVQPQHDAPEPQEDIPRAVDCDHDDGAQAGRGARSIFRQGATCDSRFLPIACEKSGLGRRHSGVNPPRPARLVLVVLYVRLCWSRGGERYRGILDITGDTYKSFRVLQTLNV
jgi:hypothetical protein